MPELNSTTPGTTPLRTAIVGVSGYAGGELARLLLNHPRLASVPPLLLSRAKDDATADSSHTVTLADLHPQLAPPRGKSPVVHAFDWQRIDDAKIEILFLATPHEQSREWVPQGITRGLRVIDLSGAWRLQDPANRAVYNLHDADTAAAAKLQAEAVYGCPELHRDAIRTAKLIANPGCYATSILLAAAPFLRHAGLIDLDFGILADAKSGVSGAGKAPTPGTHFMHAADNLSAYKVFGHRHTGELLEQLHLTAEQVQFTPHLLPIPRGILSTVYMRLHQTTTREQLIDILMDFYRKSPLVRVRQHLPEIQHIVRTAFCDLGLELSPDGRRLVVVSCLDNLLKGAASQAVQNMNLMAGWNEAEGLL